MNLSRTEVNLRRLLAKCELMMKSNQREDERFPKYLESLENMLKELTNLPEKVSREVISDYGRRILNLRTLLDLEVSDDLKKYQIEYTPFQNVIAKETNNTSQRKELLGLRQRQTVKDHVQTDLDEVIEYNRQMQDKIAEEMIIMTQSLKEQSELANKIIKKDIEVINRSTQISEQNFMKLKAESNKLAEHSKKAWKCWMWVMLLIVLIVFINMVIFMKIMKKKSY